MTVGYQQVRAIHVTTTENFYDTCGNHNLNFVLEMLQSLQLEQLAFLELYTSVYYLQYQNLIVTFKQYKQCICNMTLRRICVTIVAGEKHLVLHILSVCL
jgi:hypothetical protein